MRWEGNDSRGPIFEKTSYVDLDARGYRFEQLGNGIDLYVQGDGDNDTYTRNEPMATGAYVHAVVTFDGTTYRLYRDGVLVVSEAAQGTATSSAGGVGIGGNTEDGDTWKGLLQEVAVYDHALSAERIQAHFAIVP